MNVVILCLRLKVSVLTIEIMDDYFFFEFFDCNLACIEVSLIFCKSVIA